MHALAGLETGDDGRRDPEYQQAQPQQKAHQQQREHAAYGKTDQHADVEIQRFLRLLAHERRLLSPQVPDEQRPEHIAGYGHDQARECRQVCQHSPATLFLARHSKRLSGRCARGWLRVIHLPASRSRAALQRHYGGRRPGGPMSYQPVRIPRHEYISVRGLQHRLTWWGEPGQRPVVLLHGFMDCGDTWQFLVDCLPPQWSLVALDWRGFGGSDWAPGGYWFADYLADLEVLLDALTPGTPARVIGHSMGANIAALYCGVRPQRLAWLVSLEGVGLPDTRADMAPARYAQWLDELRESPRGNRYARIEQLAGVLQQRNARLT